MLGLGLAVALEDEAPRKGRDITVYLRVKEVSEADEASGEGHGDTEMVHYPEIIEAVFGAVMAGEPPHGPAVAGEPALPRLEDLPEALPAAEIIVRLIEEAVAEARAYDGGYQQGIKQRVEQLGLDALALEEPLEDVPSQDEAGDEQQRIPPDSELSDVEYDGVHVPVDEQ